MEENATILDWDIWAMYVVTTIKAQVKKNDAIEQELKTINICLLQNLTDIRDDITHRIDLARTEDQANLSKLAEALTKVIDSLGLRLAQIEAEPPALLISEKMVELKDNIITPLRLRLAGISALMGAVGGILAILLADLLKGMIPG